MKLFNNKQDEPQLSPQSVALVNEIAGIVEQKDKNKPLLFAVRYNQNYHADYLTLKDKLKQAINDNNNFYFTRLVNQGIDSFIKYTIEDTKTTPPNFKRVVMTYLTNNQDEIDTLFKAIDDNKTLDILCFVVGSTV